MLKRIKAKGSGFFLDNLVEPRVDLVKCIAEITSLELNKLEANIIEYLQSCAHVIFHNKFKIVFEANNTIVVILPQNDVNAALKALAQIKLLHHIDYQLVSESTKNILDKEVLLFIEHLTTCLENNKVSV